MEILIFENFIQVNKVKLATTLTSNNAIIGPDTSTIGLIKANANPQAVIEIIASNTPFDLPYSMLRLNSFTLVDTKKMPVKTTKTPNICSNVKASEKTMAATRVVMTNQLADIGDIIERLPFLKPLYIKKYPDRPRTPVKGTNQIRSKENTGTCEERTVKIKIGPNAMAWLIIKAGT